MGTMHPFNSLSMSTNRMDTPGMGTMHPFNSLSVSTIRMDTPGMGTMHPFNSLGVGCLFSKKIFIRFGRKDHKI
jgi:hypothetical protein